MKNVVFTGFLGMPASCGAMVMKHLFAILLVIPTPSAFSAEQKAKKATKAICTLQLLAEPKDSISATIKFNDDIGVNTQETLEFRGGIYGLSLLMVENVLTVVLDEHAHVEDEVANLDSDTENARSGDVLGEKMVSRPPYDTDDENEMKIFIKAFKITCIAK